MVLCCSRCLRFIFIFLSGIFVKQEAAKWNSIEDTPSTDIYIQEYVEIVSNVCPYSDFCTRKAQFIYHATSNSTEPCCKQCSCSPTCIFQHNCCIDAPISAVNNFLDISKHMSCSPDSINFESPPKEWNYYYMVDSCPLEDGTELSCRKTEYNETTPADLVFVSRRDGLVTYMNEECARCHNVTDFIRWTLSVADCEDDLFKLKLSGIMLLQYVMFNCNAFSRPPAGLTFSPSTCREDVISQCSSNWNSSDSAIAELCEVFPAPPVSQSGKSEIFYKNVFCLLCNFPDDYKFKDTCQVGKRTRTPLGFILNLNLFDNGQETYDSMPADVSIDTRCIESEIMDPYFIKCRPLKCPFQTTPAFGTCHQPPLTVNDPVLALSFIISIQEDVITEANETCKTKTIDINAFLLLANITSCKFLKYTTKNYISKLNSFLRYIHLNIYLLQTYLCPKSIIEYIYYDHVFSMNDSFPITLHGHSIDTYTVELSVPLTGGNVSSYDVLPHIESYDTCLETYKKKTRFTYYYGPTEGLPCPSLVLTEDDFLYISSQHEAEVKQQKSTINLPQRIDRFISKKYYINGEPRYLHFICLDDYMPSKFLLVVNQLNDLTKGTVTLVFAITSMVCIIVCIAVFSLTGNNQSFPSKVFQMALYNLLLAQAFFQFGIERTKLPYPLCVVIGMLVHYFWLTTVFSLNAFCVVVATKLSAINNENRVHVSAMVKVLLYIYVLPGVFVGANITYSKSVRGKFGYGETLCYIDEAVMRGFLFAVPIIVIVFVNCFVYFYIVYKTRATSAMAGRKSRDMKYATVYFRLLLLTGVSWVFGFLNEIYSSDILQYCFIVTTAGQGIFLFFAFYVGQIRSAFVKLTARVVIRTSETSDSKM